MSHIAFTAHRHLQSHFISGFQKTSIPNGSVLKGAFYRNLKTGHFVAKAADVMNRRVLLQPTQDFGGQMTIVIEALAENGSFRYATSGLRNVNLYFDPVADGPSMSLPPRVSNENAEITLPFNFTTRDIDGSETLGDLVYIKLCQRASFVQNFPKVVGTDSDASLDGKSTIGFSRVPVASTTALKVQPDRYWHGLCDVDVVATSIGSADDADGDHRKVSSESFTITVKAVPTPANLTAPAAVQVDEGAYVSLAGLSADYVYKITENGYETLPLFVSNVPKDSLFNKGTNVGDGVWSFSDPSLFSGLTFRPPFYFSGNIALQFTAITRESTEPDLEANVTVVTKVTVRPVASPFLMVAQGLQVARRVASNLVLNVRMEDNVKQPGETELELIQLTFSPVPTNVSILASSGGTVNLTGTRVWMFQGTQNQSNALRLNVGPQAATGNHMIQISGRTKDGNSVLATPVTDDFRLTVVAAVTSRHLEPEGTEDFESSENDDFGSSPTVGSSTSNVFLTDLPSASCVRTISIEGEDRSKITESMFTLLNMCDSTLEFRFPPQFASSDNFYAITFAEAPIGVPSYPVLLSGDNALTLNANCYAHEVLFYIFVNSNLNNPSQALVPTTFTDLSANDRADGSSRVYKVTLPCSLCPVDEGSVEQASRHLQKFTPPRLHKALAASMSATFAKRKLQQAAGGEAEISLEIKMDVPPEESSGTRATSSLLIATCTLAALLLSYLI